MLTTLDVSVSLLIGPGTLRHCSIAPSQPTSPSLRAVPDIHKPERRNRVLVRNKLYTSVQHG